MCRFRFPLPHCFAGPQTQHAPFRVREPQYTSSFMCIKLCSFRCMVEPGLWALGTCGSREAFQGQTLLAERCGSPEGSWQRTSTVLVVFIAGLLEVTELVALLF